MSNFNGVYDIGINESGVAAGGPRSGVAGEWERDRDWN